MSRIIKSRRKFLQLGAAEAAAALMGNLAKISLAKTISSGNKGIVVHEDEGIHILTRRKVLITVKISKTNQGIDNISFCTEEMNPGRKMRVHKHLYNDKLIFIHRGEGTLTLDEKSIEIKTGAVAFVPRDVWHGLDNTGNRERNSGGNGAKAKNSGRIRQNRAKIRDGV